MKNILILILICLCGYLGYQKYLDNDICLLPASLNQQANDGVTNYPGSLSSNPSNEVILYTTSSCQNCKMTKSLLENRGIKYTNYDIERSKEGRERHEVLVQPYRKAGQIGVPLIVINGTIIYGFNESLILAALK